MYTAKRSSLNRQYYVIYLNGRAHRVCHRENLATRWLNIKIED